MYWLIFTPMRPGKKLEVEKASVIVSAIDDSKLVHKIEGLDVEAEKIVLTSDSDEVRGKNYFLSLHIKAFNLMNKFRIVNCRYYHRGLFNLKFFQLYEVVFHHF
ncbi:hypothetical protein HRED_11035 [Candidatus Haloredivivus sp. G17]|nr:hypothetical protein HRED_11035 [Candidatus Haloredivivus sp. G17]